LIKCSKTGRENRAFFRPHPHPRGGGDGIPSHPGL